MKRTLVAVLACVSAIAGAHAEPIVPRHDDEIVESLPATSPEQRRLRRTAEANPADAQAALALARHHLDRAREQGDPREAGRALAALRAWPDAATSPDEVLLMRALVEQHLHAFDPAADHLERLLERRPRHAQAWLTLATVRRVQGRIDAAERACAGLAAARAALHAAACSAENAGLRGDVDAARRTLQRLLATPSLVPATRGWLLTTLAELETRAGQDAEAERAWRAALGVAAATPVEGAGHGGADAAAPRDPYAVLGYADVLLAQRRPLEALALLDAEPATDAVRLRTAIASRGAGRSDADRLARDVRERMALAALRPDVRDTHARELAMAALWLDDDAPRALALARVNVRRQREPVDLLLLAAAARAARDPDGLREAATLRREIGLHDRRLDALL